MRRNSIVVFFCVLSSAVFAQNNIFSISYSNQIGMNQFNSIQNDYHNNDKFNSGYSYKNVGLHFERKISAKRNLWLNFSVNVWDEEYKFDYYPFISDPSKDPFNWLTEDDFINQPERGSKETKNSSWLQMVDLELSLKKVYTTKWWGIEVVPEIGLYTKTDFGLMNGFRHSTNLIKEPATYKNYTTFNTNDPENNNNVFGFCSLNLNKSINNHFQFGLDITYLPRIKMNYEVSSIIQISVVDESGQTNFVYSETINDFTKAQLVYDLFRFGVSFGYKF